MVALKPRVISGLIGLMLLAAILAVPWARAGMVWLTLGDPAPAPRSGATFETDLLFSSWDAYLGAFQVTLTYDPDLLQIEAIAIPASSPFHGQSYFNPSSFSSGQMVITGFQVDDFGWQDPPAPLATIRWKTLGPEGSSTQVAIETQSTVDVNFKQLDAQTFTKSVQISVESNPPDSGGGGGGCFLAGLIPSF